MAKKNRKTRIINKYKDDDDNNINNNKKPDPGEAAAELIVQPYITEKTFNMIERENKLTFIVSEKATKKKVAESLAVLYESEISEVNTSRSLRGKKAVVKFAAPEGARDLATKLGLV